MEEYTLDYCKVCGKFKALLNGKCSNCQEKEAEIIDNIPDFFKDIFK